MITLMMYLTWPKFTGIYELTTENLVKITESLKGPDFFLTAWIDFIIIAILGVIIGYKLIKKYEPSSKEEP